MPRLGMEEEEEDPCEKKFKEREKKKPKSRLIHCPRDPRFQQMNATVHCFSSYVDWHRCRRLLGADYKGCFQFLECYLSLCPEDWIKRWDEQIANGTFQKEIYPCGETPPCDSECLKQYLIDTADQRPK